MIFIKIIYHQNDNNYCDYYLLILFLFSLKIVPTHCIQILCTYIYIYNKSRIYKYIKYIEKFIPSSPESKRNRKCEREEEIG